METYDPRDTQIVRAGGELIGFYVVRHRLDHLYLDHVYIRLGHQGRGLGRNIVCSVQDQARKLGLPVRLVALCESSANEFYVSCGFVLERSDNLDNYYTWAAERSEFWSRAKWAVCGTPH
ncbi:MAG: GNAT family N-acetyltransferase [Aliishimia sp.]